ncbi:saccharopine dehydrogenase [Yoonia sp. 208BN28-4]|uniref:saccharopine dehydrogenase n=1 Tax=Yoonia sp. 208BN28-4 TaxID=3126505 RepID=UPI0030A0DBAB
MTHFWIRAEERANEERTGITPDGAAKLIAAGFDITVEESLQRAIPISAYKEAGCAIAPQASWHDAPDNAVIFGLKELPEADTPLHHRHIMFGHAYKGQASGRKLLDRFKAGGGTLLDLEYLTHAGGKRVAAFGYWAGYAGAAVALHCWLAQQNDGQLAGEVSTYPNAEALVSDLRNRMTGDAPDAMIIGALGRVGSGAAAFCDAVGIKTTKWDKNETENGGPFPEILTHQIFLNCILAHPGTPVFVAANAAKDSDRALRVIGDIACDPESEFSPVKVYDRTTTWQRPALRVHGDPLLDVTAIDNLPAMLPKESSEDFAEQLLPHLLEYDRDPDSIWLRARDLFVENV